MADYPEYIMTDEDWEIILGSWGGGDGEGNVVNYKTILSAEYLNALRRTVRALCVTVGLSPPTTASNLIRKDADDDINTGVTTTWSAGSQVSIGNDSSVTLQPGAQQVFGGSSSVTTTGATIVPPIGTLGAEAEPDVNAGNTFDLNGATTPTITWFSNGTANQVITIKCIGNGCTIIHDPSKIDLQGDVNFSIKNGDTITFKYSSGVWNEQSRHTKDGSRIVGQGATIVLASGSTTIDSGENIATVYRTFDAGDGTIPDVSNGSIFGVRGSVTPTITDFTPDIDGKEFTLNIIEGGTTITWTYLDPLYDYVNYVTKTGDISKWRFQYNRWSEISREAKDGSRGLGSTGEFDAYQGSQIRVGGYISYGNLSQVSQASGSLVQAESGSTTSYQSGSTVNVSGVLNTAPASTVNVSGVLDAATGSEIRIGGYISYGNLSQVSQQSGSTVTAESGSTTTYNTGSVTTQNGAVASTSSTPITTDGQDTSATSRVEVNGSSPATIGTLTTTVAGQQLIVKCTGGSSTMTNFGNIALAGGVSFTMQDGDVLTLEYDAGTGKYQEVSRHLNNP